MSKHVCFLVVDIETAVDGALVASTQFPGQQISPQVAVATFRQQRLEETGSDFVPYTFHIPVSVVVGKVASDFRLIDLVALDEPEYRPHVLTDHFWRGWEAYGRPTIVTYNGRGFDLPVLEMAAFRYGIRVPAWFDEKSKAYEQPRNRYNSGSHTDLMELLTNYGATRFFGGLNLAATLLGKPGKTEVHGGMVQDLFEQGRLVDINDYCRGDVLDTYFVFLRTRVLLGYLTLQQEQDIVAGVKSWLETLRDEQPGVRRYLAHWADWTNPWDAVSIEK
jgi:hypothetical protein